MLIKKMSKTHLDDVCTVETLSLAPPWSKKMFLEELESKTALYFVAEENDRAIAYMGMHSVCGEGHITNVAVHPDYRKQGIAQMLINHFISYSKENDFEFLTLEVRESNIPAISLYKKFGFTEVGVRKNYYEHKENAILMTLFFK